MLKLYKKLIMITLIIIFSMFLFIIFYPLNRCKSFDCSGMIGIIKTLCGKSQSEYEKVKDFESIFNEVKKINNNDHISLFEYLEYLEKRDVPIRGSIKTIFLNTILDKYGKKCFMFTFNTKIIKSNKGIEEFFNKNKFILNEYGIKDLKTGGECLSNNDCYLIITEKGLLKPINYVYNNCK